jgi:hypothetical protein
MAFSAHATFYASIASSGTVSAYHAGADGKLTALGTTSGAARADATYLRNW